MLQPPTRPTNEIFFVVILLLLGTRVKGVANNFSQPFFIIFHFTKKSIHSFTRMHRCFVKNVSLYLKYMKLLSIFFKVSSCIKLHYSNLHQSQLQAAASSVTKTYFIEVFLFIFLRNFCAILRRVNVCCTSHRAQKPTQTASKLHFSFAHISLVRAIKSQSFACRR